MYKEIKRRNFVASLQMLLKLVVVDMFIQDSTMMSEVLCPKHIFENF